MWGCALFKRFEQRVNGLKLGCKNRPTLGSVGEALFQDGIANFRGQGPAPLGVLATSFGIAWHVIHSRTHTPPCFELIPKSDVLVKKVVVQRAKRSGPRRLVLGPPIQESGWPPLHPP
jgi:hypothetical protein